MRGCGGVEKRGRRVQCWHGLRIALACMGHDNGDRSTRGVLIAFPRPEAGRRPTTGGEAQPGSGPQPLRLMDRIRNTLRLGHYSRRTENAYLQWIRRFILFHNKQHPEQMAEAEITKFLTFLAVEKKVSASTQNQALAAILFLYQRVLERQLPWLGEIVHAKRPDRLPVVLSRDETTALLDKLSGAPWLVASLLYGAGLRLLEGLRLRVKDVDLQRRGARTRRGRRVRHRPTETPSPTRKRYSTGGTAGHPESKYHQARHPTHPAALVCDASARRRLRHPNHPGVTGAQGCFHYHDLHPRSESGWPRRPQPTGSSSLSRRNQKFARHHY